jgi:hypothetical protein
MAWERTPLAHQSRPSAQARTRASGSCPASLPAPSGGGVGWGRVGMNWERTPPARSPPAPARASGSHPAPPLPAPSGGGVGWGRVGMAWERTPLAHQSRPSAQARTRASGSCPASLPAPSGGGVGWGRVGMAWERTPPARSPPAPAHASGSYPAPPLPAPSGGGKRWGRVAYHHFVCRCRTTSSSLVARQQYASTDLTAQMIHIHTQTKNKQGCTSVHPCHIIEALEP